MKTRDSGMPDEDWWNTFFDPPAILRTLDLDRIHGPVVDVGCGYGTFTMAIARCTRYPVIALDIEPDLVAEVRRRATQEHLEQVQPRLHDIMDGTLGVGAGSADVVLLFNILHCEAPLDLLRMAYTALRPGGRVGIIHWRSDVPTPRGPPLEIRPTPERLRTWTITAGFVPLVGPLVLPPYHVGLVARRPPTEVLT